MTAARRAAEIARRLRVAYPGAHCELHFRNPLELLVATMLSAQCTDRRVNLVTAVLFERCRTANDYAAIAQEELERIVRPTGFFRNKARNLRAMAKELLASHAGEPPRTLEALAALPGVGRKTANVVLGNAFGINEGVVVDTHIGRLARRLGLSPHENPVRVEQDLAALFPREDWTNLAHWLIWHGRRRCKAQRPDCAGCELRSLCPSAGNVPPRRATRSAAR